MVSSLSFQPTTALGNPLKAFDPQEMNSSVAPGIYKVK
jgi:hypothetical protein